MNEFQVIQQARFLAAADVWPGGTDPVFGKVFISIKANEQLLELATLPILVIRPGAGQADPGKNEDPRLIRQAMGMRLIVDNKHDAEAEAAIIGAHRKFPVQDSDGRGLLEVQERLIAVLGQTTGKVATRIILAHQSSVAVEEETPVGQVLFRDYVFQSLVSNDRFYHGPTRLAAVDAGGGDADLTWLLPPARWDFFRVELVRKAGSSPPANPGDGTSVLTSDTLEAFTDSPGTGTFSYSLFAQYDENDVPTDSADIDSAPDTVTVVVA